MAVKTDESGTRREIIDRTIQMHDGLRTMRMELSQGWSYTIKSDREEDEKRGKKGGLQIARRKFAFKTVAAPVKVPEPVSSSQSTIETSVRMMARPPFGFRASWVGKERTPGRQPVVEEGGKRSIVVWLGTLRLRCEGRSRPEAIE